MAAAVSAAAAAGRQQVRPPEALRAFEQSRRALVSGRVEWLVTREDDGSSISFVSRYARNGDTMFENRGDADGWTIVEPQTNRGLSKYPQLYLVNEMGTWYFQESDLSCSLWKKDGMESPWDRDIRDVRSIGVSPFVSSMKSDPGVDAI